MVSILFLVLCGVIIFTPFFSMPFFKNSASEEKREKATFPSFWLRGIASANYFREMDNFLQDNFGLREQMVKINSLFNLRVLHTSSNPFVLVGKNGWLFYNAENAYENYSGQDLFTKEELAKITEILLTTKEKLENKNIKFLFVIAPNKHSIYSDELQKIFQRKNTFTQTDQVDTILEENSIPYLDLRKTLSQNAQKMQLYYKTDTHWNNLGAYLAYKEISKQLNFAPYEWSFQMGSKSGGDLSAFLSLKENIMDTQIIAHPKFEAKAKLLPTLFENPKKNHDLYTFGTQDTTQPKAVVFRDSFSNALVPYLSEHFSQVSYVWTYNVLDYIIEEEHPDVVVVEIVERYLNKLLEE